ncbi:MAG: hypothetical protein KC464_18975, partial [Myxococcales bacterium]|nr:hypothetical protein [Myxococcales bacterium]
SLGAGGSLLVTGVGDGTRNRGEAHLELLPGGRWKRYGLLLALRHATFDPPLDDALITAGVVFEAAASRPRLSLALHADVGFQLAARAPAAGGGLQTHLWLAPRYVPIALVFDLTGHLVVDGVDDTALVLSASTALAIAW